MVIVLPMWLGGTLERTLRPIRYLKITYIIPQLLPFSLAVPQIPHTNAMMLVLLSAPMDISFVKISDDQLYEEVALQNCQSVSTEVCLPHKQSLELPCHQTTLCSPQCLLSTQIFSSATAIP